MAATQPAPPVSGGRAPGCELLVTLAATVSTVHGPGGGMSWVGR
jgi:hypothetical protein